MGSSDLSSIFKERSGGLTAKEKSTCAVAVVVFFALFLTYTYATEPLPAKDSKIATLLTLGAQPAIAVLGQEKNSAQQLQDPLAIEQQQTTSGIDLHKYLGIRSVIPDKISNLKLSEYHSCTTGYYDKDSKKCQKLCANRQCTAVYTFKTAEAPLEKRDTIVKITFNPVQTSDNSVCVDGTKAEVSHANKDRQVYSCKDSFYKVHYLFKEPYMDRGKSFVSIEATIEEYGTDIENEDASAQIAKMATNSIIANFDKIGTSGSIVLTRD